MTNQQVDERTSIVHNTAGLDKGMSISTHFKRGSGWTRIGAEVKRLLSSGCLFSLQENRTAYDVSLVKTCTVVSNETAAHLSMASLS